MVAHRAQDRQRLRPGPRADRLPRRSSPSRSALFLLIFGLIRGNPEGWGSRADRRLPGRRRGAAGARSSRSSARSDHPMLDLTLFRKPAFNGVSAVAFGLSAGMFAMFLYLTIYMQGVLDYSPLEAGLRFLPLTVLGFIVSPIAGALSHRIPIRVLLGTGLGAGRRRPAADARDLAPARAGRRCSPASSSPGSASASPTPGSARRRSRSCRWRNRGWGRGSTPPSARSGSPPASPALGAVFQSRVDSKLTELLPHAPAGLGEIVASGGSRAVAELPLPPAHPRQGRPRRQRRLRQRLQRDPPDRRDPLLRRRRPRLRPGPLRATSSQTATQAVRRRTRGRGRAERNLARRLRVPAGPPPWLLHRAHAA